MASGNWGGPDVSVYVPVDLQRQVRAQYANCCAYCRTAESLTVVTFEFEHILPRSAGGKTILENLCLACPTCNRLKADRTSARDPVSSKDAALFHPQRDRWAEHFAWTDGGTAISGLTPTGRATVGALRMNRPALVRVRRMWVLMGASADR